MEGKLGRGDEQIETQRTICSVSSNSRDVIGPRGGRRRSWGGGAGVLPKAKKTKVQRRMFVHAGLIRCSKEWSHERVALAELQGAEQAQRKKDRT